MSFSERLIIIGSTGRHTGKTEFCCKLITAHAISHKIIGLKVVCFDIHHLDCHKGDLCHNIIFRNSKPYEILEELIDNSEKDTSRMLRAGAYKSYLINVRSDAMAEALNEFLKLIPQDSMIVAESNSLRLYIEPALFIVIKNHDDYTIKKTCLEVIHYADRIISFLNNSWDFIPDRIFIKDSKWFIRHKATAIILAGGKSSRMGGEEKSLLKFNDKPLIQHIVEQLEAHFQQIIIGANDVDTYRFLNKPVIPDLEKDKGPLMGILSCLKYSENDINFITACDIPEMNIRLIDKLLGLSSDVDVVMPVSDNDKYEPLFAVYNKKVIIFAEQILKADKRKITDLLKYVKTHYVSFENDGWYYNLNRKTDYIEYINKKKCKFCNNKLNE